MIRSLYTGTTGLKGFQQSLDNIGNNISNVNTTAYKANQMTFSTLMSQNLQGASKASNTLASTNGKQIGLGMTVGANTISITKAGAAETTGDKLDFRIDGNSFFAVHKGNEQYYTKDGSFAIDANGNLVMNNGGYYVDGWTSTDGRTVNTSGAVGTLNIFKVNEDEITGEATTYARIEGNLDYKDAKIYNGGRTINLEMYGSNGKEYTATFRFTDDGDAEQRTFNVALSTVTDEKGNTYNGNGQQIRVVFDSKGNLVSAGGNTSGKATFNLPAVMGGSQATLDVSKLTCDTATADDVEISGSLPDWVTVDEASDTNGYMASTYTTTETYVGGSAQIKHSASSLDFSGLTAANKSQLLNQGFYFTCCTCDRYYSIKFVNGTDSKLTTSGRHYIYEVGIDDVTNGTELVNKIIEATGGNPEEHYTMLEADGATLHVYDDRSMEGNSVSGATWTNWANPQFGVKASEDWGKFGRGVAGEKTIDDTTSMTALKGDANGYEAGKPVGTRTGWSADTSGKIYAEYSNGAKRLIGQMATARFQNPFGLEKVGDNLYGTTLNSGQAELHDVTDDNGMIINGQLEMSNVDLAEEMSNMIITQRAFQASSRIITTSDSMLQTLSELKR